MFHVGSVFRKNTNQRRSLCSISTEIKKESGRQLNIGDEKGDEKTDMRFHFEDMMQLMLQMQSSWTVNIELTYKWKVKDPFWKQGLQHFGVFSNGIKRLVCEGISPLVCSEEMPVCFCNTPQVPTESFVGGSTSTSIIGFLFISVMSSFRSNSEVQTRISRYSAE